MKKVIVTGATGFVGRALTGKLLRTGKEVTAVVRNPGKINDLSGLGKLKVVQLQLSCYDQLPGLLDERGYDVFYHLAWDGVYGKDERHDYNLQLKNVKGACDAVKAAATLGCRKFVYAGTIRQYESCDKIAANGEAPKHTNLYALCKDMAEKLCKIISVNEGIEFCTGLISLSYGAGSMSEMLPNLLIRQLLQGTSPKLMKGNKRYELVYISDIADALVAIGEKGKDQRTYYIGHRDTRTFEQLMTGIRDIVNPEVELEFGSYKDSYDIDYSAIDVDALYNDTGFECKADFRESIIKTMEWVKKQEK